MNRNPRIATEFFREETKARNALDRRSEGFYTEEWKTQYEKERLARLEAYRKANNGKLPAFQREETPKIPDNLPSMSFSQARSLVVEKTKGERKGMAVHKYRALTV